MNARRGAAASLFVMVGLAPAVLPEGSVAAEDAKVYGGDWCVPEDDGETSLSYVGSLYAGSSASSTEVICPIMRDNTINSDGLVAAHVDVHVPNSGTVWCRIYSYSQGGSQLDVAYDGSSTPGDQALDWGMDIGSSDGSDPSYYFLRCSMPTAGALIYSYKITEY